MTAEGPQLEALTRRLAECPSDFLLPSANVRALVADLLRDFGQAIPPPDLRTRLVIGKNPPTAATANRFRLIVIAVWLLADDWFRDLPVPAESVWQLLSTGLDPLSDVVAASTTVSDPDRREEMVRFVLWSLDLRPAGESDAQAQDRLTNLDSVERVRVVRETRAAEQRAREIREAMARKEAEEAAASYGRE